MVGEPEFDRLRSLGLVEVGRGPDPRADLCVVRIERIEIDVAHPPRYVDGIAVKRGPVRAIDVPASALADWPPAFAPVLREEDLVLVGPPIDRGDEEPPGLRGVDSEAG